MNDHGFVVSLGLQPSSFVFFASSCYAFVGDLVAPLLFHFLQALRGLKKPCNEINNIYLRNSANIIIVAYFLSLKVKMPFVIAGVCLQQDS